jgi:K+ transporter
MHTLWETCKLAFRSLGIVYGDLGTSPLYVYPSITCVDTPNEDDYLGILSLIFWTLTLIGIMKYTFIVLYVDDHGEGDNYCSQKYFVILVEPLHKYQVLPMSFCIELRCITIFTWLVKT